MEKEFLDYTEALELKELGFDEPCFGNWQDMKEETPWFSKSYSDNQNQYYGQLCLAPTYSQAFRWFREEYDLKSSISYSMLDDTNWYFQFDKSGIEYGFKTYEDAELECIKKLIEIVKEK